MLLLLLVVVVIVLILAATIAVIMQLWYYWSFVLFFFWNPNVHVANQTKYNWNWQVISTWASAQPTLDYESVICTASLI